MHVRTPRDPRPAGGDMLGDEVYHAIGAAIVDGRLMPGQRLRDTELAQDLGVSRTPVREALQRLERAGLVEVSPNRYTRVSTPGRKMYDDTLEFIVFFMTDVLRISLRRCSDDALAGLVAQADAVVEASRADDADAQRDASSRFFELATLATENFAIMMVLSEADLALRRNLTPWSPAVASVERRTLLFAQFRDAVAARDGVRAAEIHLEVNGFA